VARSRSRRGNRWDNAVAESFISSLKKERIKKRIYKNTDLANADISDYIESFLIDHAVTSILRARA
jgi:putative transposase